MNALLPPLPAFLSALWRRATRPSALPPRALEDRAIDRLLPMMLGNAPHPYQASLMLYLLDQQRRERQQQQAGD